MPHFLVIGTQKGGTTTLHKLLQQHPKIYLPECKEVHYFTLHPEKSVEWYGSHYANSSFWQCRGDITPYYMFHPKAAKRIHNIIPKTKLIVLLRDPVERTLSQVFHAKRHGFENLDITNALDAERERLKTGNAHNLQKHSYVARSRYIEQLKRYEELFAKEQMLILKSEDLFNDTKNVIYRIQKFLNIRKKDITIKTPKENAGLREAANIDPNIRIRLKSELADTVREVKLKYGIDWGW